MGRMIDMTEGEAEYLKYRFKQYLGSVSRAIQNKRLEERKMGIIIDDDGVMHKIFTKDEVIDMLDELKKEIIELPFPQREPEYMQGYSYCQMNILDDVIQEKINSLKENK